MSSFEISNIKTLEMVDMETGEKLSLSNSVYSVEIKNETSKADELNFNPFAETSCEINVDYINDEAGSFLFGFDTNPTKATVYFDIALKQQVRRHKKKRINKKWAKRYGYKTIICPVEAAVSGINDIDDGWHEMQLDDLKIGETHVL